MRIRLIHCYFGGINRNFCNSTGAKSKCAKSEYSKSNSSRQRNEPLSTNQPSLIPAPDVIISQAMMSLPAMSEAENIFAA